MEENTTHYKSTKDAQKIHTTKQKHKMYGDDDHQRYVCTLQQGTHKRYTCIIIIIIKPQLT